jgi:hypothetical protein
LRPIGSTAADRRQESEVREKLPKGLDDASTLRAEDWELQREVCGGDPVFFEVQTALLGVERKFRGMTRRTGIFEALERSLRAGMYQNEQEAVEVESQKGERRKEAREVRQERVEPQQLDLFPDDGEKDGNCPEGVG